MAENKENNEKKEMTFEEGMARLEQIVLNLEKGEAPLESSMELFTEGTKLSAFLQKKLDEAEAKVKKLTESDGRVIAEDFEPMTEQ